MPGMISFNHTTQFKCDVCNAEVSRRRWRQHRCCENINCRYEMRRRNRITKAEKEEERAEEARKRHLAMLEEVRKVDPNHDPRQLVVVPFSELAQQRPTILGEKRKRRFRDNLMQRISEATESSTPTEDELEDKNLMPPDRVKQAACEICKGRCCETGGEEAHITAQTIQRFMASHPQLRPRHILQAYLERLPVRSVAESCVFHTENGCALTRDMRSEVCNAFECRDLKRIGENPPAIENPILFVSTDEVDAVVRIEKSQLEVSD